MGSNYDQVSDPLGLWSLAPDDWDRKPIWDLGDYQNGRAFKPTDFSDSGLPVIKITELKYGLSESTRLFAGEVSDKYKIFPGDLLFAWSGNPETSLDVFIWDGPEGILNQHIFKVTPATGINKWWLFFVLRYMRPTFILTARDKATSMGHVKVSDLKRLHAAIPSDVQQQNIGRMLGQLEEKRRINRRTNLLLDEFAKTVYKAWFLDFEPAIQTKFSGMSQLQERLLTLYPRHMENGIPAGWKRKPLSEFGRVVTGKTPPTKHAEYFGGGIDFVTPSDLNSDKFVIQAERTLTSTGVSVVKNCVLPERSVLVSCIGSDMGKVALNKNPCVTNQQINSVIPGRLEDRNFLYYNLLFRKDELKSIAGGSAQPILSKQSFSKLPILMPGDDLIDLFHQFSEPILERIRINLDENVLLAALIRELLPQLMTGAAGIKQAATALGGV